MCHMSPYPINRMLGPPSFLSICLSTPQSQPSPCISSHNFTSFLPQTTLISLLLIICFTAVSTFFPLIVTGTSSTSTITLGTCLGVNPWLIGLRSLLTTSSVNACLTAMRTNRKTLSSVSLGLRRPTYNVSVLKAGPSAMA